jgi:hypothetical protein
MDKLYDAAYSRPIVDSVPEWIKVQECAMNNDDDNLERMVRVMAQKTVQLPIVRQAKKEGTYIFEAEKKTGRKEAENFELTIREDDIVILDVVSPHNI